MSGLVVRCSRVPPLRRGTVEQIYQLRTTEGVTAFHALERPRTVLGTRCSLFQVPCARGWNSGTSSQPGQFADDGRRGT